MSFHVDPGNPAQVLSAAVDAAIRALDRATLPATAALVAWARIDAWRPWQQAARTIVSEPEMARVLALRRPVDRERRLLTYALHRLVVGHWLGLPPPDVSIGRDARGCPRLPCGTAATSLSHAGALSAFVVCLSGPVGIDIEPLAPGVDLLELAASIAHPHEALAMARLDDDGRRKRLLELWVRKEACLKAAGIGLAHPMAAFEAGQDGELTLPAFQPATKVQLHMLSLADAWTGALAVPAGVEVAIVELVPPGG